MESRTIKVLNLSKIREMNDNSCFALSKEKLPNLVSIMCPGCFHLTDVGLEHLINGFTDQLEHLSLSACTITDQGVKQLMRLTKLQSVKLNVIKQITNRSLEHVAQMKSLKVLALRHSPNISQESLEYLRSQVRPSLILDQTSSLM